MRTFGNAIPGGQNEPTGNYQGRTDLVDLQNGYAVIDLEMAGEDPRTGLIIEMAVGVLRPGQNLVTDRVLVKIDRPIPESIVRLTGITDRDLAAGGIPIDDALGWFAERTSGLPLVGHNVLQSDRAHLVEAARRHRQAVEEGLYPKLVIDEMLDLPAQRFIDTAGLYKGYLLGEYPQGGESHQDYAQRVNDLSAHGLRSGLTAACEDLGIPTSRIRAHRATGDVVRNQLLFEKLLELNPHE